MVEHCIGVIEKNGKPHSTEKERLKALFEECNGNVEALSEVVKELSRSFLMIAGGSDSKYVRKVWIKYLNLSSRYINYIPDALIGYIDAENYKLLFSLLKAWVTCEKSCPKGQLFNRRDQALQFCQHVVLKLDPDDVPSLLLMGQIYKMRKSYGKAREVLKRVLYTDSSLNGITALACCYDDELRLMLRKLHENEFDFMAKKRIKEINSELRALYEENIDRINDKRDEYFINGADKTNYVAVVCRYARWLKSIGDFEKGIEVLYMVPEDYPGYCRVLLERGLIFQCRESNKIYNPMRDLTLACDCLVSADRMFKGNQQEDDSKNVTLEKSILVPLANTLFELGEYIWAERVCADVLEIDCNEKNALKLMKSIEEKMMLFA